MNITNKLYRQTLKWELFMISKWESYGIFDNYFELKFRLQDIHVYYSTDENSMRYCLEDKLRFWENITQNRCWL